MGGLERTLNFDASCAERQLPGCARLLAAQANGLACREDPLESKADKRGRSRQVYDSILEGLSFVYVNKHFVGGYAGVDAGSPPRSSQDCHARESMHCPSLQVVVPVSSRKLQLTRRHGLGNDQSRVLFWRRSRAAAGMSPSNGTARLLRVLPAFGYRIVMSRVLSFCSSSGAP